MQRLCGRPGCSDAASVAYGMRAEDLVFWLDVLPERAEADVPVLCQRHADSMVVPRGWTLDDLRDPELHLFRPPLPAPTHRTRAPRPTRDPAAGEQLQLGAELMSPPAVEMPAPAIAVTTDSVAVDDEETSTSPDAEPGPWTPSFDEADDLDGLLAAHSPLLSRAFRTANRTDG